MMPVKATEAPTPAAVSTMRIRFTFSDAKSEVASLPRPRGNGVERAAPTAEPARSR